MDPRKRRPYEKLNGEQLRQAEATACRFLEDNSTEIAGSMRAKMKFLDMLIQRISRKEMTFEKRLESLARISEIARVIQDDADGFFELASQPAVARLLATVRRK